MEVLFFLVLGFVLLHLLTPPPPNIKSQCPPHKWKNIEVKDKDGNTVMWKLVCEKCGPPQR